jgi:hypothetical protein
VIIIAIFGSSYGLPIPAPEHHELIGIGDNDAIDEVFDVRGGYVRFDAQVATAVAQAFS